MTPQRLAYSSPLLPSFFLNGTPIIAREEQKLNAHIPCSLAKMCLSFGASFLPLKISNKRCSCSEGEGW